MRVEVRETGASEYVFRYGVKDADPDAVAALQAPHDPAAVDTRGCGRPSAPGAPWLPLVGSQAIAKGANVPEDGKCAMRDGEGCEYKGKPDESDLLSDSCSDLSVRVRHGADNLIWLPCERNTSMSIRPNKDFE